MTETTTDGAVLFGPVTDALLSALRAGHAPDLGALAARYPAVADQLPGHAAFVAALFQCENTPEPTAEDTLTGAPDLPLHLGDFRLLRELGRGGMGVVYEAEQVSLRRRVALKILPVAAMLEPRRLQRFQNEAQAAAQLQHPHIVPVFAVGSDRGLHYYAMQLVVGQTLATLLRQLRQAAGMSGEEAAAVSAGEDTAPLFSLPTSAAERCRTVAAWGRQIAEALYYAHETGVIHRDIKPGNLLLDGRGKLWLTDFGLARLRGDDNLTGTGDIVGTLRYMSPEQAQGAAAVTDHRTDIYSLGATLYELLTLEPALPGDEGREVLHRRLVEEEPRPPRSLNPAIPVDLETVVLKALRKEPLNRYATAQELAEDLQRYLEQKPVLARRPTWRERGVRWLKRHPTFVTATTLALVVAVLALAAGMWAVSLERQETQRRHEQAVEWARQARQAQGQAEAWGRQARLEQAQAEEWSRHARQAVDDMYTAVAQRWLAKEKHLEPLQREFLLKALSFYERYAKHMGAVPEVQLEVLRAYRRVGDIRQLFGEYAQAEEAFQQSITRAQALGTPAARTEEMLCLDGLARLMTQTGRKPVAEQLQQRVAAYWTARAAAEPQHLDHRYQQAKCLVNLAVLLYHRHAFAEAEQMYRQAEALYDQLLQAQAGNSEYRGSRAILQANHGALLAVQNQLSQAEVAWKDAELTFAQLAEEQPADRASYQTSQAGTLYNLAQLYVRSGQEDKALAAANQAETLDRRLQEAYPHRPTYRLTAARSQLMLGKAYLSQMHLAEAEKHLRQGIAALERLAAEFPANTDYRDRLAEGWSYLGKTLTQQGRFEDAVTTLQKGLRLQEELRAANPGEFRFLQMTADITKHMADALSLAGRYAEARDAFQKAVDLWTQVAAQQPDNALYRLEIADARLGLGVVLFRLGQTQEAIATLKAALDILPAGASLTRVFIAYRLALAYHKLDQRDQAKFWQRRALEWTTPSLVRERRVIQLCKEVEALLGPVDLSASSHLPP